MKLGVNLHHGTRAHLNGVTHNKFPTLTIVARKRLGKKVTAARNTHATIKELSDSWFSMLPALYEREACL
jgi:hypothetical protein